MRFGDLTAVDNIDVDVKEGEIFGFLGPNGAGKTTTIRILTTLLHPTSGSISIDGISLPKGSFEARKLIGMVQQQISLDKDISVRENIIYHAILHKVPRAIIKERLEELSERIGITPYLDHAVITLSGGWKRKAAIICALMHSPRILFLDEPTAGLDVEGRQALHCLIRNLKARGKTILLASHDMTEVESLCDRIAIITGGRISFLGSAAELAEQTGSRYTVSITTSQGNRRYEAANIADTLLTLLEDYKRKGMAVLDIRIDRGTLEQHFMELVRRKEP